MSAPHNTESVVVVTLSVPSLNDAVVEDSCRVAVISSLVLLIRCQHLKVGVLGGLMMNTVHQDS